MSKPSKTVKPEPKATGDARDTQTSPALDGRSAQGQSMELLGQGGGLGAPMGGNPADGQGNELRNAEPKPVPKPAKDDTGDGSGDGLGDAPPDDSSDTPADAPTDADAPPADGAGAPPDADGTGAPPAGSGTGGPPADGAPAGPNGPASKTGPQTGPGKAPQQAPQKGPPTPVDQVVEPLPDARYTAPKLSDDDADRITQATGQAPGEHAALIQKRLASLKQTSGLRRDAAARHITTQSGAVTTLLSGKQTDTTGKVKQARIDVSGAYGQARTTVKNAAKTARAQVGKDATAAEGNINSAATKNTQKSKDDFGAYQKQVDELTTEWQPTFQTLFDDAGTACKDTAAETAKTYPKQSEKIDAYFKADGDALQSYLGATRIAVAKKKIPEAANAMIAGGAGQAKTLSAEGKNFAPKVKQTLDPVSKKAHTLGIEAEGKVAMAKSKAEGTLKTERTKVDGEINNLEIRTVKQLDADEKSALGEIDIIGNRIKGDIETQKSTATGQFDALKGALAGRYNDFLTQAQASLPADGFVSAKAATKALDGLSGQLEALHTQVLGDIDGVHGKVSTALSTTVDADIKKLDGVIKANTTDVKTLGDTKAKGISDAAAAFGAGMLKIGDGIDAAMADYTKPTKASLAKHKADCLAELRALKKTTETELNGRKTTYAADLKKQVAGLCPRIRDEVFNAAREKEKGLETRAKNAYSAMRGMGTDEDKLFDALRGMEKGQPGALRVVFKNIAGSSLDSWLVDDLDEDELKIARAHLSLNHGAAARLEIADNINWYGDDEAQVEKILRGLPEAERKKIAADPAWKGTRTLLKDNLDGADLDVANALVANKVHRADAIRLKEKLDAARRNADHDAIHTALEGVKPEDMEKIAQEFAHITGKVDLDKGGKIKGLDAKKGLAAYATKQKDGPTAKDGLMVAGVGVLTLGAGAKMMADHQQGKDDAFNKGGANHDLTTALIMNGANSVEARVARLEVENTRDGGPKDVNLEKALYADPKLQDALHSQDPKKIAAAQKKLAEDKAKFNALYEQKYGKKPTDALKTIGDDKDKRDLYQQMLKDGFNSPEVAKKQIKIAVDGAGTDEDAIKRALKGMHPDEIKQLKKIYPELEKDLGVNGKGGFFTELSGQDRMDVEIALMGDEKYMNDRQRFELAKKKYNWQRGDEGGIKFDNIEGKQLDKHFKALEGFQSRIKDGKFQGTPEEYEEYRRTCRYVGITAALYQEQSDRIANAVTSTIAIAGAVVAAAVTGGAASPLVAMAVAGAVGGTSMAANAAIKGGRYGWEDAAKDLGVTAVNVATAGAGAKLTQGANALTTGKQLAAKTAIAAGSGGVNSAATTVMTDKTWDEGFGKGMGKTLKSGAKGALVAGGTAFASNAFEATKIGAKLVDSNGYLARGAGKAISGGLGGFTGANIDIGFDVAAGDWKGTDWSDWGEKVGTETGKATIQGGLEGVAEAGHHRYKGSKNTDAIKDEERPIDQRRRDAEAQAKKDQKALVDDTQQKVKTVEDDASAQLKSGDEDGAKTVEETHTDLTRIEDDGTAKTQDDQSAKFEKTVDQVNQDIDSNKKTVVDDTQQKLQDIDKTHQDAAKKIEDTRKAQTGDDTDDAPQTKTTDDAPVDDAPQTKKTTDDAPVDDAPQTKTTDDAPVDDAPQTKKAADDAQGKTDEPEIKIDLTPEQETVAIGAQKLEDQVLDRLIAIESDQAGNPLVTDAVLALAAKDPSQAMAVLDTLETFTQVIRKDPRTMTPDEMTAVLKAHHFLDAHATPDYLRKVIPENGVLSHINRKYTTVGNSVGDPLNTEGIDANLKVEVLGLDYDDNSYVIRNDDNTFTAKDEVYFIDVPMTDGMREKAKIPVDKALIEFAKTSDDPEIQALVPKLFERSASYEVDPITGESVKQESNPYTATGATATGSRLPDGHVRTNQERVIPTDFHGGYFGETYGTGTQIKYQGPDGKVIVVATFVETPAGSIVQLNPDLPTDIKQRFADRFDQRYVKDAPQKEDF